MGFYDINGITAHSPFPFTTVNSENTGMRPFVPLVHILVALILGLPGSQLQSVAPADKEKLLYGKIGMGRHMAVHNLESLAMTVALSTEIEVTQF